MPSCISLEYLESHIHMPGGKNSEALNTSVGWKTNCS